MNNKEQQRTVTLDGMMTFGKLENGLRACDFACIETVQMEPFAAHCKVQAMRDGNVYITEQKPRLRNKPLFRQNHSSLSLGRDGKYYFVFQLPASEVDVLGSKLMHEALETALKLDVMLSRKGGRR